MREIRPYFLHTRQNNAIDGRLELEIRKRLALLQQRMAVTGQRFGSYKQLLPDGTRLELLVNKNGPVPLLLARVFPVATSSVLLLILESGLLYLPSKDDTLLTIYTGNDIQGHTEQAPADLGIWIESGYLIGKADAAPCLQFPIISDYYKGPNYISTVHTGDNRATSDIFKEMFESDYSGISTFTSRYTGAMRLAVQAKLGANKHINELVPSGWAATDTTTKCGTNGIIWADDYTPWVVHLSSSGCFAAKLVYQDGFSCVARSLPPGEVPSDERSRLAAWLLAYCTVDTSQEPIELISQADMEETYAYGTPLAYSWHFSRFTNQAAIVLVKSYSTDTGGGNPLVTAKSVQAKVDFEFSDIGVPSASLTYLQSETEFKVHNAFFNLWLPNTQGYTLYSHIDGRGGAWTDFAPFAGNEAALYCYYDSDDNLKTLSYTCVDREQILSTQTIEGSQESCGGDAVYWKRITPDPGGVYQYQGGFSFEGDGGVTFYVGNYTETVDEVMGGGFDQRSIWFPGESYIIFPQMGGATYIDSGYGCGYITYGQSTFQNAYPEFYAWAQNLFTNNPLGADQMQFQLRFYTGSDPGVATQEKKVYQNASPDQIAIIPREDAEALYVAQIEFQTSKAYGKSTLTGEFPLLGGFEVRLRGLQNGVSTWFYSGIQAYRTVALSAGQLQAANEDGSGTLSGAWGVGAIASPSTAAATADGSASLFTSGNKALSVTQDPGAWSAWALKQNGGISFRAGYPVICLQSFGGDALYLDGASGIEKKDGYEHAPDAILNTRWIGWA